MSPAADISKVKFNTLCGTLASAEGIIVYVNLILRIPFNVIVVVKSEMHASIMYRVYFVCNMFVSRESKLFIVKSQ